MISIRFLVAALLCGLAQAAPAPFAAAADLAQANAAFEEGQRLFLAGNYREALAAFDKGYLATDDAAFLLNMAQCHRFLKENKEALRLYQLYLKSTPEGANPEAREVATKAVRELEPERTISVRKVKQDSGGFPVLEPLPDLDAKQAPARPPDTPSRTPRRLRVAGIVCGAAGLAAVGAGIAYWARAKSLSDSANSALIYHQPDYDAGKRAETMQWIFYSAGGAAIATGAILYFYGRRLSAKQTNVSLAPLGGPGVAGLLAHGAF
jgi:tetratricopeptide (TPR) repeat protein